MKIIYATYIVILLIIIGAFLIVIQKQGPEKKVIGQWKEVSWEYDKTNFDKTQSGNIDETLKQEIYQNLVIHKAEIWDFKEGHDLVLYEKGQIKKKLKWNIKGRGNILELAEHVTEDYQIKEMNNDTLIIHFNFDLQVRGIVKMTFVKLNTNQHVAKI